MEKTHNVYPIYSLVYPDKQHGRKGTHHYICGRGLEFFLVAIFLHLQENNLLFSGEHFSHIFNNLFPDFSNVNENEISASLRSRS